MLRATDPTQPRGGHPGALRCCQDRLCCFKMDTEQLHLHLAHVNATQTLGQCLHLNEVELKHSLGMEQIPQCSAGVPRSHPHGAREPGCCCKKRSLGLGLPTKTQPSPTSPSALWVAAAQTKPAHRREGRSCDRGIKVNLLCDTDLDYPPGTGLNITPEGREEKRRCCKKAWPCI